jgi:hypothetical protein
MMNPITTAPSADTPHAWLEFAPAGHPSNWYPPAVHRNAESASNPTMVDPSNDTAVAIPKIGFGGTPISRCMPVAAVHRNAWPETPTTVLPSPDTP